MPTLEDAKKRGRPSGQAFPISIPVRFAEHQVASLDVAAAAESGEPSRSELIRRIVTDWLQARGIEPSAEALGDRGARREQANMSVSRQSPRRTGGAAHARSHANDAADVLMRDMDATAEEKTRRRNALTSEPPVVARARAKRRPG